MCILYVPDSEELCLFMNKWSNCYKGVVLSSVLLYPLRIYIYFIVILIQHILVFVKDMNWVHCCLWYPSVVYHMTNTQICVFVHNCCTEHASSDTRIHFRVVQKWSDIFIVKNKNNKNYINGVLWVWRHMHYKTVVMEVIMCDPGDYCAHMKALAPRLKTTRTDHEHTHPV